MSTIAQRGGAGIADRFTSGGIAGPARSLDRVTRITFGVRMRKARKVNAATMAAVAAHIDTMPGAVVVEEERERDRLWVTLAVWPPMLADAAVHAVESCPQYVADTAAVYGRVQHRG